MLKTPDIEIWNKVLNCTLGDLSMDDYNKKVYGVTKKNVDIEDNFDLLVIYRDALNSKCLDSDSKCSIIEGIRIISKYCKTCKKEIKGRLNISISDNYSDWIETDEYIACLIAEYEEWGYINCIESTVDLCKDLDIQINVEKVCQDIIAKVSANKIPCTVVGTISSSKICSIVKPIIESYKQNCLIEDIELAISDAVLQCAIKTC